MLLAAILGFGILTLWVPGRWALTSFQLAIFALAAGRVIARIRSHKAIACDTGGVLLALIPLWGILQILLHWTVDGFRTSEEVLNWTTNVAAFCLALDLVKNAGRRS